MGFGPFGNGGNSAKKKFPSFLGTNSVALGNLFKVFFKKYKLHNLIFF